MFLFDLIILILFLLYGGLIVYYHKAWKTIPPAPGGLEETAYKPFTSISVIIPARNEAENILDCLDSLSRQSYPKTLYQVIVIDDQSTDNTWELLQKNDFPGMNTRHLQSADYLPSWGALSAYKKFAIETGIGTASGELIVTTDADCRFHPDWLRTIAAFYEYTGARFIAAPVRIDAGPVLQRGSAAPGSYSPKSRTEPRSFLGIFQALDFLTLQGITGAAVYKRFHSMCNGANLAYPKQVFYEVDGFRDIDRLPSGDDMLLMHKIYTRYPQEVFFLKDKKAIVSTKAETGWRGFINQRIRWASKADSYDDKRIFAVLLLVYLVNLLLLIMPVLALVFGNAWWLGSFLAFLVLKTLIEYPFVRSVASFFGQRQLCVYFPFLQPFHILYTVIVGWLGKFGSYRWKDRKISK